ncbi:hypothetical protein H6P81_011069 [Aristolochia fimbriata]|uniref:Uncharacterized protein n=1 Tax=Aristolochia fimbriata TaxID=158543 RepID=A0AAV7ERQ7_ARIFI|nr:hypothetical protein H6P81_011069 [Aristolochia fimbriata]
MAGKYRELTSPALKPPAFTPILCFRYSSTSSTSSAVAVSVAVRDNVQIGSATSFSAAAALPPRRPESDASDQELADPVSPRIGCMGQIKNRKVLGAPEKGKGHKFRKLKKMFSSKSLRREEEEEEEESTRNKKKTTTTTTTTHHRHHHLERSYSTTAVVGIVRHRLPPPLLPPPPPLLELDPPLPVARLSAKNDGAGEGGNNSLWKRRCGAQLKTLQLQQQRLVCTTNPVSNIASI